jgi:type IV pilus assembly protein PilB
MSVSKDVKVATVEKSLESIIPFDFAVEHQSLALKFDGSTLLVAAPKENWGAVESKLSKLGYEIKLFDGDPEILLETLRIIEKEQQDRDSTFQVPEKLKGDAPVAMLIQQLIEKAVHKRASDLHFEPYESRLVTRIRVDGHLANLLDFPISIAQAFLSRIKVLSNLNIVERRRPQDGQFRTTVDGRIVDVRVATSNTIHGEKVVLRLHDARRPAVSLPELGMSENELEIFKRMINSTSGLIFSAGPTGSGKTTTLHSALRAVTVAHKNVVTIEDPVEYVVDGISQIPVSESSGVNFAVQLRAILRQDPDIILVGETRDAETARISVQAALTGHLVLSSIHATDCVGAVYRLLQMDIEPHLVASALRGVVSQRLIRRICQYCKVNYVPSNKEKIILSKYNLTTKKLYKGLGCTFCGGSGYRDRVAAYQVLEITDSLAEAISGRPQPNVFRKLARDLGMVTIDQSGMNLAIGGVTSIEEALTLMEGYDEDMEGYDEDKV